ncbi:hypothetical protein ACHAXT_008948 [Thalassiosira profunda]
MGAKSAHHDDVSSCKSPPIGGDKDTLEHFLQWRGWDVDGILREYDLSSTETDAAVGLLSHPLTFPLTLGRHLQALLPETPSPDVKKQIRLCCVGARAECTLPDDFWRELLVAAVSLNDHCSLHCTIDFVGPDVPKHLTSSKTISLIDGDGCGEQQPTYELTLNYHTSFLHEVVLKLLKSSHATNAESSFDRTEQIRQFWDGFVLYNPGLGHPNLSGQWEPTLKFLVGTGKPLLLTAHSTLDAERDRMVLETLLAERGDVLVQYKANPFASRMSYADPFGTEGGEVHIVRPNHSVLFLQ